MTTARFSRIAALVAALGAALTFALAAAPAQAANGCGPADWRGRFVPNAPVWFNFKPACDWHDRCYATPWNRVAYSYTAAKTYCDKWFYYKMSQVCARQGWNDYRWCQYLAYSYYNAVVRWGGGAFSSAQRR
jgi:hypothetical protein